MSAQDFADKVKYGDTSITLKMSKSTKDKLKERKKDEVKLIFLKFLIIQVF